MCQVGAGCGCKTDVSAILDVFRVVAPELDDVLNNDVTAMIVFVADMVSKRNSARIMCGPLLILRRIL